MAPVLPTFSLPARSARFNLPIFWEPSASFWTNKEVSRAGYWASVLTQSNSEHRVRPGRCSVHLGEGIRSELLPKGQKAHCFVHRSDKVFRQPFHPNPFLRGFSDPEIVPSWDKQVPNGLFVDLQESAFHLELTSFPVVGYEVKQSLTSSRNDTLFTVLVREGAGRERVSLPGCLKCSLSPSWTRSCPHQFDHRRRWLL